MFVWVESMGGVHNMYQEVLIKFKRKKLLYVFLILFIPNHILCSNNFQHGNEDSQQMYNGDDDDEIDKKQLAITNVYIGNLSSDEPPQFVDIQLIHEERQIEFHKNRNEGWNLYQHKRTTSRDDKQKTKTEDEDVQEQQELPPYELDLTTQRGMLVQAIGDEYQANENFKNNISKNILEFVKLLYGEFLQNPQSLIKALREGILNEDPEWGGSTFLHSDGLIEYKGFEAWTGLKRKLHVYKEPFEISTLNLKKLTKDLYRHLDQHLSPLFILLLSQPQLSDIIREEVIDAAINAWLEKLGAQTAREKFLLEWQLSAQCIGGCSATQSILDNPELLQAYNVLEFDEQTRRYKQGGTGFFPLLSYYLAQETHAYKNLNRLYLGFTDVPWINFQDNTWYQQLLSKEEWLKILSSWRLQSNKEVVIKRSMWAFHEIIQRSIHAYKLGFRTLLWNTSDNTHWRMLMIHCDDDFNQISYTLLDPLFKEGMGDHPAFMTFTEKHALLFNQALGKTYILANETIPLDHTCKAYDLNSISGLIGKRLQNDPEDCAFAAAWTAEQIIQQGKIPTILYDKEQLPTDFFQTYVEHFFTFLKGNPLKPILN